MQLSFIKIFRYENNLLGLLTIIILALMVGDAAAQKNATASKSNFVNYIPAEDLITWRRHIHANPELSFEEEKTSQYVVNVLEKLGNIEIIRPVKTSVIGIL